MAVSYRNSYGTVAVEDGGVPRSFTFKARANISGGYWVNGSSALGVVGSGAETFIASDIEGYPVSTQVGSNVIGLCLQDTASGTYGAAITRGTVLLPALSGTVIGSIYAGWKVSAGSAGTVVPWCSGTSTYPIGIGNSDWSIGRARSQASIEGEFVVVSLNL